MMTEEKADWLRDVQKDEKTPDQLRADRERLIRHLRKRGYDV